MDRENGRGGSVGAALVVGGGIAGMQAALDLGDSGIKVYLLEKTPWIGGRMAQLDKTFPTNDCAMCIMSPRLVECARHSNIEIISNADMVGLSGDAGDFTATVRKRARYVDVDACTGCAECEARCPVEIPSVHNFGLARQKAISRSYAQAVPQAFAIQRLGIAACKNACPAGQSAQGYLAMIAQRRYADALRVIMDRVPFPSICGRVCNHPCELNCARGQLDQPVAVSKLKQFVGDLAAREGLLTQPKPERTREETIAVIGSGPGGLTAARDLVLKGYGVTVFEELPVSGGMLRVGIPEYRLPAEVIEREVQAILDLGVELRLNTRIDDLDALFSDGFNSVLIAVGAHEGRDLDIPGADLDGVLEGTALLRDTRLGNPPQLGRRVAVLGGGDVAFDVARTALRLGPDSVNIVYRRSRDEMPASAEEVEWGEAEGIDFTLLAAPTRFLGENGRLVGIECLKMELGEPDESGRRRPVPVPGSEFTVDCDSAIFAIGQDVRLGALSEDGGVAVGSSGTVAIDPDSMLTNRPGVFAAGDAVVGTSFAVDAIAAGHRAATAIDRFLTGKEPALPYETPAFEVEASRADIEERLERGEVVDRQRIPLEKRVPSRLTGDFGEVEAGYTEDQAVAEAERCLACGVCSDCGECEAACLPGAIRYNDQDSEEEIRVGAVILAPGTGAHDARLSQEFGFGRFPNVITSLQFERLLSAAGPTGGHVLRQSDNEAPSKIAWLQCIGSRDQDHAYCSAVCCMYATKEAMIAKEHMPPDTGFSIFQMDLRAFGKGFDAYYRRAQDEGIRYVQCRASTIKEDPASRNLLLQYEDESGERLTEEFDMVVLSVGLTPPVEAAELAEAAGVGLTPLGFAAAQAAEPLETDRPGVYVCGSFRGPKDIPDSVTDASAAAGGAQTILASGRDTLVTPREFPPELDTDDQEPRVGVFVCHCGSNIASVIDVKDVASWAAGLPHVAHTDDLMFACSTDSLEKVREAVVEHKLNRVVVSSCTPRTHEPLFQENLREAGLNPYLFDMANIRDQCSWVHGETPARATAKAKALVAMSVARACRLESLHKSSQGLSQRALVVGGGVAGMTAALTLADQGFETVLVEREARLGGMLLQHDTLTSGLGSSELVTGLIDRVNASPVIEVLTESEVTKTIGFVGNFKTNVASRNDPTQRLIEHGVSVIATGGREHRGNEYLLGEHPAVMTTGDLEQALQSDEDRLKQAKRIVIVQCVGPWEEQPFYCSRVCCTVTMKNVRKLKELNPSCEIVVLHKDIRTYGVHEEMYTEARRFGAVFVRYTDAHPPVTEVAGDRVKVSFREPSLNEELSVDADLVVLSTAIVPSEGAAELNQTFKIPLSAEGFFQEAHSKLRPVDFASEGTFLCGVAHYPKSVEEAVVQGKAAAGRATRILSKKELMVGGVVSHVDPDKCTACLTCVRVCPYDVPIINQDGVATIEAAACQGCGICAAECPAKAIQLLHYSDDQVVAKVEALGDLIAAGEPTS